MANILIIDDDRGICEYLSMVLGKFGNAITSSLTLTEGLKVCSNEEFDLVLLDVNLPDGNGLESMPQIQNSVGRPEVIIITGEGDPDGAELAINCGAWDYIEKPFLLESIILPVKRALLYHQEKKKTETQETFNRQEIIGKSSQIKESLFLAQRAVHSRANILITGETGTGKELFARAIHYNSSRSKRNFVVVDCAALPKTLVESILFGHEKGAFTGAEMKKEGLVSLADGGTLFLDEVGELPLSVQKKFLRVLQEKKFRSVGGESEQKSDFCLISATNRNLEELGQEGQFRQDLLFRLRNIHIELPPLRNREGDIEMLVAHYINKFNELNEVQAKTISLELLDALRSHNWPGNVRELINVLDNVIAAAGNSPILYPEHLPVAFRAKIVRSSIKPKKRPEKEPIAKAQSSKLRVFKQYRENIVHEAEAFYLADLMDITDWDIKEACRVSGLSRPRLYALLKKHNISRKID